MVNTSGKPRGHGSYVKTFVGARIWAIKIRMSTLYMALLSIKFTAQMMEPLLSSPTTKQHKVQTFSKGPSKEAKKN